MRSIIYRARVSIILYTYIYFMSVCVYVRIINHALFFIYFPRLVVCFSSRAQVTRSGRSSPLATNSKGNNQSFWVVSRRTARCRGGMVVDVVVAVGCVSVRRHREELDTAEIPAVGIREWRGQGAGG